MWRQENAVKENDFFCFAHTRRIVFRFIPPDLTGIRFYSRRRGPARGIADALTELGLSPSAPVKATDSADPSIRESWAPRCRPLTRPPVA